MASNTANTLTMFGCVNLARVLASVRKRSSPHRNVCLRSSVNGCTSLPPSLTASSIGRYSLMATALSRLVSVAR